MPSSNNAARLRKATTRFDKNVTRKVATNSSQRKNNNDDGYGMAPLLIAFFAFVVIGSGLLEVFRPRL